MEDGLRYLGEKARGVLRTLALTDGTRKERLILSLKGDLTMLLDPRHAQGHDDILDLIHAIREFLGDDDWSGRMAGWNEAEESLVFADLWDLIWLIDDRRRSA